jgi:hypothetical protein
MKNKLQRICLLISCHLLFSSVVFAQYDTASLATPKMKFQSSLPNPLNERTTHLKNLSPGAYLQNSNASKNIKNNIPLPLYHGYLPEPTHTNDFLSGVMNGGAAGLSPSLSGRSPGTYMMNSASSIIGFAMGVLAGGVAGGLLSNKYYTYGAPSPFNDFLHFNKH